MSIWVGQMEEALAPSGIARGRIRSIAARNNMPVQGIYVRYVKDDTAPPAPLWVYRLRNQVEVGGSGAKPCEAGVPAAMDEVKAQHGIEANGARLSWVASVT